jgi:hypothetical protein
MNNYCCYRKLTENIPRLTEVGARSDKSAALFFAIIRPVLDFNQTIFDTEK